MLLLSRLFLLGGTITTALSTPSIPPEIPKRIVVKSNQMGLKKQLKLLKRFEAIQTVSASSYKPKEKTRFKKKTNPNGLDDEALRLLRRKKATLVEAATGPSVTPLYIIDGYNVINQWPKLKKLFRKGDLEESRRKLIDELCELSAMKGARYLIIFDGACNLNTFNEPGFTTSNPRVSVMFSSNGKTADDLIEAKAFEMREAKLTGKIVVVTNDVEVKRQAEGQNLLTQSSNLLISEMKGFKSAAMSIADEASARVAQMSVHSKAGWRIEDNVEIGVEAKKKKKKKKGVRD